MYTQTLPTYLISAAPAVHTKIVRDRDNWETFNEADVQLYFDDIHAEFVEHIMKLQSSTRTFSETEINELQFMLDSLIQAKLLLQNQEVDKRK